MATLQDLERRVRVLESSDVKAQLDRMERLLNQVSNTVETKLGHATSLTVFDALDDLKEQLGRIETKLP